jgi:catechol 2,3-dioxygenase-like lactoylglutathione lyase family enzyme
MKKLALILWTKNLRETITFYQDVLGFRGQSNFPDFVTLIKDEVEIMFVVPQDEPEDCKEPGNEEKFFSNPKLTGSIYIFMHEVEKFWNVVKDKARIKSAIDDREYLMRDFSIFDNNGYELVFGEDISNKVPDE